MLKSSGDYIRLQRDWYHLRIELQKRHGTRPYFKVPLPSFSPLEEVKEVAKLANEAHNLVVVTRKITRLRELCSTTNIRENYYSKDQIVTLIINEPLAKTCNEIEDYFRKVSKGL